MTTKTVDECRSWEEVLDLIRTSEQEIRLGGGEAAVERQHQKGRLTARERIERLIDPGSTFFELAGILVASILAISQQNVKQLFAYSSVAQVAYMMLALGMNNTSGLVATLLHLFNHALMKGALFLALAAVMYRVGSTQLEQFSGLGQRMPWTMAAIVIGGLSLIGIPLTVGFISKWYLLRASLENGWWPVAVFILLGSLLAGVYVWRIVEKAYFTPTTASLSEINEAPLSLLIPTWILVLANLYFGIDSRLTITVSEIAAQSLLGTLP